MISLPHALLVPAMMGVAFLSSHDKSQSTLESQSLSPTQQKEVQLELQAPMRPTAREAWGPFALLQSTGNNYSYFQKTVYAVKVYPTWYSGTVSVHPKVAQAPTGGGMAYISVKKYDQNHNLIEQYGPSTVDESGYYPFNEIHASNGEYIIVVFQVINPGSYMCWF